MANTIIVTASHFYSGETVTNTDEIKFQSASGADAYFDSSQFGGGNISNNLLIVGDQFLDQVIIDVSSGTSFSAAGWTFQNFPDAFHVITLDAYNNTNNVTLTASPTHSTGLGGGSGNDILIGGSDDDSLSGGLGTDTLQGGAGNDSYTLQDVHQVQLVTNQIDGRASSSPIATFYAYDTIIENQNEGIDSVDVQPVPNGTSYTLPANVENGTVFGAGNFSLSGNGEDNILTGNSDANVLQGFSGADTLNGEYARDTLIGGTDNDIFIFDMEAWYDSQSGVFDEVKDYDQGNKGLYDHSELDWIDVSGIVHSLYGPYQPNTFLRFVSDPSNSRSLVQVDSDATASSSHWMTVAGLDGIHASEKVFGVFQNANNAVSGLDFSILSDDGHFGDFDSDGFADVVWRNNDGSVAVWEMNSGSPTAQFLPGVGNDWHILGEGDFDGNGKTDILWQNDDGTLLDWQMADSSQIDSTPGMGAAPANSFLAGIGDVDHDGKSDLIWRDNSTGAVTINTMAGASNTNGGVGTDWAVVGVGDFNGDGNADVFFRHQTDGVMAYWQMNSTSVQQTVFLNGVPAEWHVEAIGDFDGNGSADIFWHSDSGGNAIWLMDNGQVQQPAFFSGVTSDWHVVGTGDFNNDHKDDLIWRADDGSTAIWLMNGAIAPNVSFPGGVPNDWATQAHHYEFI